MVSSVLSYSSFNVVSSVNQPLNVYPFFVGLTSAAVIGVPYVFLNVLLTPLGISPPFTLYVIVYSTAFHFAKIFTAFASVPTAD